MTFKRALVIALAAAAALPASAAAQEPIAPPGADNYLQPYFVKGGSELVVGDILGFSADTTNYTTQADLFNPNGDGSAGSGGPSEPTVCEGVNSTYGKTIWSVFHSKSYGTIDISAASGTFDEVIRVIPFDSPSTDPTPQLPGACYDNLVGSQESASGIVFPHQWFAVQVGGTINATSPTQGGPVQVKFTLRPPPKIGGDAVLSWKKKSANAPVKVTKLVVSAPRGARVSVSCTKHGCKGPRPFTAKRPQLLKPLGAVGPVAKPQVHAAKSYKLLKGRTLKAGSRLIIRITATGYIGKYFSYPVTKRGVSAKTVRCTNPGSSKPRKKCG